MAFWGRTPRADHGLCHGGVPCSRSLTILSVIISSTRMVDCSINRLCRWVVSATNTGGPLCCGLGQIGRRTLRQLLLNDIHLGDLQNQEEPITHYKWCHARMPDF